MLFISAYIFEFIGTVAPPPGADVYGDVENGLPVFVSNIIKTLIVIAGLYAVFNFVLAGYSFMSAGGDPKKIADAWAKIWQTILGLTIAAGAFVIAAIVGALLFRDFNALLQLRVFGP
jgi:hypothetical protein